MTAHSQKKQPSHLSARVPEAAGSPLLPPELPWLYMVVPLPAAYLLGQTLVEQSPAMYLAFVAKTIWFYTFTRPSLARLRLSAQAMRAGLAGDYDGHARFLR